jgi:hypothetical protein
MLRLPQSRGERHPLLLGVTNGLAVLFQVSAVLLWPAASLSVLRRNAPRRQRLRDWALYSLLLFVIGIMPYLLYAVLSLRLFSFSDPLAWLRQGVLGGRRWSGSPNVLTLPFGIGSLFIGEDFVLRYISSNPDLRHKVISYAPILPLSPPVRDEHLQLQFVVLLTLTVLVTLGFLLVLFYAIRSWRRIWSNHRALLSLCLVWIIPFALFGIWYFPMSSHHWMPNLVPLWVLFALVLKDAQEHFGKLSPGWQKGLVTGFLLCLFSVNFFGSILPAHDPHTNWNLQLALELNNYVDREDLLIPLEAGEYKHLPPHASYYIGCQVIPARGILGGYPKSYVQQQIENTIARGHRVYVLSDVFDSELGYAHLSRYSGLSKAKIREEMNGLFANYNLVVSLRDDVQKPLLYEVKTGSGA